MYISRRGLFKSINRCVIGQLKLIKLYRPTYCHLYQTDSGKNSSVNVLSLVGGSKLKYLMIMLAINVHIKFEVLADIKA